MRGHLRLVGSSPEPALASTPAPVRAPRSRRLGCGALDVDKPARAGLKGQLPCVVWLTASSETARAKIARLVERELYIAGPAVRAVFVSPIRVEGQAALYLFEAGQFIEIGLDATSMCAHDAAAVIVDELRRRHIIPAVG